MTLRLHASGALSLFLVISGTAAAFETDQCLDEDIKWDHDTVTVLSDTATFAHGSSPWWFGLSIGIDRFNENPSRFRYRLQVDNGSVGLENGSNEIWGSAAGAVLGGAPAITYSYWTCAPIIIPLPPFVVGRIVHMDEIDVIFDNSGTPQWTDGNWRPAWMRYGGDYRSLPATAIHELGHGAGLKHENDEYNVMGYDFEHIHVNGWTARAYLGEDAADGLVELYGRASQSSEDVGVVHWTYSGRDGEYSDHRRTRIYDSAGAVLPTIAQDYDADGDNDDVHYRVSPNQSVRVEFTYENNGANRQNPVAVGFYLSTDHYISTLDTRIGGASLDLGRNDVYTARHTVRIPSNVIPGQNYWIGVIVDEDGAIGEAVEWNNATYTPIRIN